MEPAKEGRYFPRHVSLLQEEFVKTVLAGISILLLVHTSDTHAQLLRGFGLKAGAVSANQSWNYTSITSLPTDDRWGISVAGFLEFFDLPYLSAVLEFQYTQKGMSQTIPVYTQSNPEVVAYFMTKRPRVDYFSIPVLAKVRFSTPFATPYLMAGPRWDFLMSTKGDGFDAVTDKFKKSDFGATFGIGVEVPDLLPFDILAEFRYNSSLRDAFNNGFLAVRNRSFDMLLGVRF